MNSQEYIDKLNQITLKYPKNDIPKFVNNLENIKNFFSKISPKINDKIIINRFIDDTKKRVVETSGMVETEVSSTVMQVYKYIVSAFDVTYRNIILLPLSWFFVLIIVLNYKAAYPHRQITKKTILEAIKLYVYKVNHLWAKYESRGELEKSMSIAIIPYIFFVLMKKLITAKDIIKYNIILSLFVLRYMTILLNLASEYLRQTSED